MRFRRARLNGIQFNHTTPCADAKALAQAFAQDITIIDMTQYALGDRLGEGEVLQPISRPVSEDIGEDVV